MRRDLRHLEVPEHLSLAYNAWAPVSVDGKVPDNQKAAWLESLAQLSISPDYPAFFAGWRQSFDEKLDRLAEMEFSSRLLIGHGNAAATDIGLTVHHTWGVPIIPGSAIKGLLAHYIDAIYGPEEVSTLPWEYTGENEERNRYRGVVRRGRSIAFGPGASYRALFGASEAERDQECIDRGLPAGQARGSVVFHDALYVPESAQRDRPFAVDVLTVHQDRYYKDKGSTPPNDYDNPNPIGFLSVTPGCRFLLAFTGPSAWTALALDLLRGALAEWGIGAKTSTGYGRAKIRRASAKPRPSPAAKSGELESPPRRIGKMRTSAVLLNDPKMGKARIRTQQGVECECTDIPMAFGLHEGDRVQAQLVLEGGRVRRAVFKGRAD